MSVRDKVPMRDLLEALGFDEPNHDGKILAPWRDETEPSVQIYDDGSWFDYGEGEGGDAIDFLVRWQGWSKGQAFRFLGSMADLDEVRQDVPNRPAKPILDLTEHWQDAEHNQAGLYWDWWVDLCSKWPTVDPHLPATRGWVKVGRNKILIPHRHGGKIPGIKVRVLSTGEKISVKGSTFTQGLYSVTDRPQATEAVILEGESDLWALECHWYRQLGVSPPAMFSLPSGAGLVKPEWFDGFDRFDVVRIAVDQDEPGQKAAEQIKWALDDRGGHWCHHHWPVEQYGKDIAEALGKGLDFEGLTRP